ncbi:hypothetical protein LX97_02978 [Nonlabens dokdonensis]|uniref:Secreted protein n=2 Tax=Nonlabens dokdonensis TaxID=328515 RepID=L7WE54_NONDD|nr:hypothetical protein [Nonlabens dokdonensis]AGC78226.1 hypothetical protein DDD_3099 [Nonlabens dokdonensis DSW-6]PZX37883.1 hypothetical protein LX97_02978 [Nonlabens dokdonensis]
MKNLSTIIFIAFLCLSMLSTAQKKKVAVITFYANKTIDLSNISGAADLATKNTSLSEDPNFNLTEPLKKLHKAFFAEYKENFDFEIIDEQTVLNNEAYKAFKPVYSQGKNLITNSETTVAIDGYQAIPAYRDNVKALKSVAEALDVDAIMFVKLSFGFVKTGVGSFGYVSIQARYSMDLYTNNNNSIFQFNEVAGSKKKAVMVGGIPVMTPKKIQPMCESAVEKLMKDLNKKVKRLAKKANRKMK